MLEAEIGQGESKAKGSSDLRNRSFCALGFGFHAALLLPGVCCAKREPKVSAFTALWLLQSERVMCMAVAFSNVLLVTFMCRIK